MKTLSSRLTIAALAGLATTANAAAGGTATDGSNLLIWFLIGFAVLVVMLQALPALIMFGSMLKGLFTPVHNTGDQRTRR